MAQQAHLVQQELAQRLAAPHLHVGLVKLDLMAQQAHLVHQELAQQQAVPHPLLGQVSAV
jgi:hypothetical protein